MEISEKAALVVKISASGEFAQFVLLLYAKVIKISVKFENTLQNMDQSAKTRSIRSIKT